MNEPLSKFLIDHLPILLDKLLDQVYLAGMALLLAIFISIPLGILIARTQRFRSMMMGFISILQTIPSLAILALLIPVFGIGVKPAIVTLCIYALLPIVANTVTGLSSVSPAVVEAANGLGFTRRQKLLLVELPLAMPMILTGIRTAAAMSVGIATIAAFVGAGGLGDFIFEGLTLNQHRLILLGAIPAALLAMVIDIALGRLQVMLHNRRCRLPSPRWQLVIVGGLLITLLLVALLPVLCSKNMVRIGARNTTEQMILGEIMAQTLEKNTNLSVVRKFHLGGAIVAHQALMSGGIDLYPEYTGTAYLVILKQDPTKAPKDLWQYVHDQYQKQFSLTWLKPLGFSNSNALIVRQDYANKFGLKTMSDFARFAKNTSIGVRADFMEREDGYKGLQRVYGMNFAHVRLMDAGLMYQAINNKQLESIMGESTDGRIVAMHLKTLRDDKKLFIDYATAPVVRNAFIKKHPEVEKLLQQLAGKIDTKTMQRLNAEVDLQHKTPTQVAAEFLQ